MEALKVLLAKEMRAKKHNKIIDREEGKIYCTECKFKSDEISYCDFATSVKLRIGLLK